MMKTGTSEITKTISHSVRIKRGSLGPFFLPSISTRGGDGKRLERIRKPFWGKQNHFSHDHLVGKDTTWG